MFIEWQTLPYRPSSMDGEKKFQKTKSSQIDFNKVGILKELKEKKVSSMHWRVSCIDPQQVR